MKKIIDNTINHQVYTSDNTNFYPKCRREKNFCPYCGSNEITIVRDATFGYPGYCDSATCDKCGGNF